jgi:S1-C subfamily serine protease
VSQSYPAKNSGFRRKDVITSIQGVDIYDSEDFLQVCGCRCY